jgi:hypothetical protein
VRGRVILKKRRSKCLVWVENGHLTSDGAPAAILRYGQIMKAILVACCAAILLTGCNAAKAQGASILSQLSGKQDNVLIAKIQARNSGSLCSLVTSDGAARLMSFGEKAVVDIDGRPTVLAYHPLAAGHEASFTGAGVRVSGDLARQAVMDLGKTISHDVTVEVQASGRAEHLQAHWTCQKSLLTVQTAH